MFLLVERPIEIFDTMSAEEVTGLLVQFCYKYLFSLRTIRHKDWQCITMI